MQFEAGNKMASGGAREGAGRKPNFVRARLDMLMRQTVDDDALKEILEVVVARARSGNDWAVEFIFDRIFGKPGTETERQIVSLVERIANDGAAEDADTTDGAADGAEDTPARSNDVSGGC